ncbi:universal stress protein UspA [Geomonas silvestris]|uniref:Universal stress protein UspA n=1 Tax=Geomonas silvestris TaxID=2740184 RepID=A0A6V8MGT0_9BACT|nr:universal stress protein [Geomonas silvestris]GFO59190.1 universal stress protein UspA [Geomonas silvestris]
MFKHLLVPTDGSELSGDAVERAVAFAREAGARITFLSVVQSFPKIYYGEGALFDPHLPVRYRERIGELAEDALGRAAETAERGGVACTKLTLVGEQAYQGIIQAALDRGCDLIFMASHGWRGIRALVLGSETHKVLTHSSIPVLVHRSARTAEPD